MKVGIRDAVLLAVVLAILGGTYKLGFARADAHRRDLQTRTASARAVLLETQLTAGGLEQLNLVARAQRQAIDVFHAKLPQEREMGRVLDELARIIQRCNLQSRTIKPLKIERFTGISEQPVQLTLVGQFQDVHAFLWELEHLPRVMRVMQMQLIQDGGRGQVIAGLTISIYFQPQGETTLR